MTTLYSLINKYYPPELKRCSEPWKLSQSEIADYLNRFVAEVNEELEKTDEKVRLYRLEEIAFDMHTFQPRAEMSEATIQRYQNAYSNNTELPPVDIATIKEYTQETTEQQRKRWGDVFPEFFSKPRPNLYLLDGFHRYKAKEKSEPWNRWIAAIYHGEMSLDDARYFSVKKNIANGLSFTKADMKRVFSIYVETEQYKLSCGNVKSYYTIAKELSALSRPTIEKYMKTMYPDVDKEIRRQHPCKRNKKDIAINIDKEGEDDNMKSYDSVTAKHINDKLADVGRKADLLNTDYYRMDYEEELLKLYAASLEKRGANTDDVVRLLNDYRDY